MIFILGISGNSLRAGLAEHCDQIYSLLHKKAQKKTPHSNFRDGESKNKIVVQNSRRNLEQPGHWLVASAGLCKGLTFPVPGNRWNITCAAENKDGRNSGGKKGEKKSCSLLIYSPSLCC